MQINCRHCQREDSLLFKGTQCVPTSTFITAISLQPTVTAPIGNISFKKKPPPPKLPSFNLICYQYPKNVVHPVEVVPRSLHTEHMRARKVTLESDCQVLWICGLRSMHGSLLFGCLVWTVLPGRYQALKWHGGITVIQASHCGP